MKESDNDGLDPIYTLSLWGVMDNYELFDNYLIFFFNPESQKVYIDNETFSEEEMTYMMKIYHLMYDYLQDTYTIENEIVFWNEKTDYIKALIIELLSLTSMERYMKKIRKNPYYKGIWNFY